MLTVVVLLVTSTPTPELRLAAFIRNLADILWSLGAEYPGGVLNHPTITLILSRILPIAHRIRAIAARVATNTLRRPPSPRTPNPDPKPRKPALRWPFRLRGSHAWLCRMAPQLYPLAGQLDALLRAPDMQALIAAAPQIRTILRPLCRMLGTTTLKPNPEPRPRQPRPPSPTPPPGPARTALIPWRSPKIA